MKPKHLNLLTLASVSAFILGTIDLPTKAGVRYFDVPDCLPSSLTLLSASQVSYRSFMNPGDVCTGAGSLCIVSIETTYLTAGKQHISAGASAPIKTVISTRTCAIK